MIEFIGLKYSKPLTVINAFRSLHKFKTVDGRELKMTDLPIGTSVRLRYRHGYVDTKVIEFHQATW